MKKLYIAFGFACIVLIGAIVYTRIETGKLYQRIDQLKDDAIRFDEELEKLRSQGNSSSSKLPDSQDSSFNSWTLSRCNLGLEPYIVKVAEYSPSSNSWSNHLVQYNVHKQNYDQLFEGQIIAPGQDNFLSKQLFGFGPECMIDGLCDSKIRYRVEEKIPSACASQDD